MSNTNHKLCIQKLFNVEDYVVVVTGGGTGIGLMIAQVFANNGARVYIAGRRKEAVETATKAWGLSLKHPKGKIVPAQVDITSKESIKALVDTVSKSEKHLDLLVNNAGITRGTSEVEKGEHAAKALADELFDEDPAEWEDVYRTNVIGHFFTAGAFLPLLRAACRPGYTPSIINNSSMSGITRTSQHHFMYNTSKAASIQLNTLLAQEFRRSAVNVRVNSIAPGIFPSEMTTEGSDDKNKSKIETGDDYGAKKGIAAGRPGREEDIAGAALMLAVNQYAYGQTVAIDGGYLLEHP